MKWFNDSKVRTKLLISFILVAGIAGLVGWVGLSSTEDVNVRSTSPTSWLPFGTLAMPI